MSNNYFGRALVAFGILYRYEVNTTHQVIIGIYHQVSVKHLDKYVDDFEFRYNNRNATKLEKFESMLSCAKTRLTYSNLIQN